MLPIAIALATAIKTNPISINPPINNDFKTRLIDIVSCWKTFSL